MTNYIYKSLLKNKFRSIFTCSFLILVLTLVNFSVQIISNVYLIIDSHSSNLVSQNNKGDMLNILYTFLFILVGFSCSMFQNIYTVLNQSRLNEFYILNTLGIVKGKIKTIVFLEIVMITFVATIISTILGVISSQIFMNYYDFEYRSISFSGIFVILFFTLVLMIFLINRTVNTVLSGDIKKKYYLSKSEALGKIILGITGIVFSTLSVLGVFKKIDMDIQQETLILINDVMFGVGVILSLDFIILLLVELLKKISGLLKINSIFIASQQLLYNFKKIKGAIISFTISIFMIVGMLGFYDSVAKSIEKYIDKTILYDYLLILNEESKISESELRDYVIRNIEKGTIELSLNVRVKDKSGTHFVLTGINESFIKFQPILLKGNDFKSIYDSGKDKLQVFVSEKEFEDKSLERNDVLQLHLDNYKLELGIQGAHRNVNTSEMFTSKEQLSKLLYNEEGHFNVIYFKDFSVKEVDKFISHLDVKDYELKDMHSMKETIKKRTISGTEVIQVFLYMIVFFTISLILNIFILSLHTRAREYSIFNLLGISNRKIISAMIIEVLIIFFSGASMGWYFGFEFVKGSTYYMKSTFVFPIIPSLPVEKLTILLTICFTLLIATIVMVGIFSIKNKEIFIKKYE